jgi:chromosomal replication initiator protein
MDLAEIWRVALSEIELSLSKASFNTWFKNTALTKRDGHTVTIGCGSNFTKEWLENKYRRILLKALRNADSDIRGIAFTISVPQTKPQRKTECAPVETFRLEHQLDLTGYAIDKTTSLNSRYTFENFVVGAHNELAHAAALAVSEQLGSRYNPLFIYGGTGLGKTHLLHAVGNKVRDAAAVNKKIIRYLTSQRFTDDLITAIRHKTVNEYMDQFKPIDLLLVDDIQFIAGKEKAQEMIFHLFNTLYGNNKQIVFSSDRPPKAIPSIEERLRSRFEGGMIADVGTPDFETRIAILRVKMEALNLSLDAKILELIATSVPKNIRELEGALNRVLAYEKIKQRTPTLKEVSGLLEQIMRPHNRTINPKQIIKAVCEFYDLSESDMMKHSRSQELVKSRQITMYFLRDILKMSYPNIGQKLGGKDHTTVIHACDKIEKELAYNGQLTQELVTIREKIIGVE